MMEDVRIGSFVGEFILFLRVDVRLFFVVFFKFLLLCVREYGIGDILYDKIFLILIFLVFVMIINFLNRFLLDFIVIKCLLVVLSCIFFIVVLKVFILILLIGF